MVEITTCIMNIAFAVFAVFGTIAAVKWKKAAKHMVTLTENAEKEIQATHGRWIPLDWDEQRHEEAIAADEYECSVCGDYITFGEITEREDLPKYCSACGTRMDGEVNGNQTDFV